MERIKKQYRYMDGIIIIFLVILSFLPIGVFSYTQAKQQHKEGETVAIVSIDGKEVDRFVLSEETPHQEKTYHPSKNSIILLK